jgi:hypothetical protein
VFFVPVVARGVFSLINETFSLLFVSTESGASCASRAVVGASFVSTESGIASACRESLRIPQDLDAPLRIAAQRKITAYQQQYADNQNISFLPAIVSTSTRMHGEFLRLLFLQAHQETEAHFTAVGMLSQNISTEAIPPQRTALS